MIKDSRMGDRPIRNLQFSAEGVWPQVVVSEGRVVLEDGTAMMMASRTVQMSELLDSHTYERLVSEADQEDVSWGDWRLTRADSGESVALEKEMGQLMKVRYERYERDEATIEPQEQQDEVGLEYEVSGSNSVMVELRENEEKLLGIQRRVSF